MHTWRARSLGGPDPVTWERVLEAKHEGATAAVVRDPDDGALCLLPSLRDLWVSPLRLTEAAGHERRHSTVLAGLLPRGAVTARALDSRGEWHDAHTAERAWLTVIPTRVGHGDPAFAFFGVSGQRIRRRVPPGFQRTTVAGPGEPCPVCAGTAWDLASRPGDQANSSERLGICRRCGHWEPLATQIRIEVRGTKRSDRAEVERQWLARADAELRELGQPAFGLDPSWVGLRGLLGYPRANQDGASAVSLVHGSLRESPSLVVDTWAREPDDPTPLIDASWALSALWSTASESSGTDEVGIRFALERRTREARVAGAPRRRMQISLGGKPVKFAVVGDDSQWAGVGALGALEVVLRARGIAPKEVTLVQIEDFAPYMHVGRWL